MPTFILVTRLCTMSGTKRHPIEIEGSSGEQHEKYEYSSARSNKEEAMAKQYASDFMLAKVSRFTSLYDCLKNMHA